MHTRFTTAILLPALLFFAGAAGCEAPPDEARDADVALDDLLLGEADVAALEEALDYAGLEVLGDELVCTDWDTTSPVEPCVEWTDPGAELEIGLAPQASDPLPEPCTYWTDCNRCDTLAAPCPNSPHNIGANYCRECMDCGSGWQCGGWWFQKYTCGCARG